MRHLSNILLNRIAWILLAACVLPVYLIHGEKTSTLPDGRFPTIQVTNLDHAKQKLPQGFDGQLNLVIVSFRREQQPVVDTWLPAAREIASSDKNFRYYELLVMAHQDAFYRWWFNGALRSNTPDKDLQSRILAAYTSQRAFQKSLRIAGEKNVVVLLVDPEGKVYWRAEGPCNSEDVAALRAALASNPS